MGPEGVIRSPSGLLCVGVGLFGAGPVNKMSLLLLALICWGGGAGAINKTPLLCVGVNLVGPGNGPVNKMPLFLYAYYFVGGRGRPRQPNAAVLLCWLFCWRSGPGPLTTCRCHALVLLCWGAPRLFLAGSRSPDPPAGGATAAPRPPALFWGPPPPRPPKTDPDDTYTDPQSAVRGRYTWVFNTWRARPVFNTW